MRGRAGSLRALRRNPATRFSGSLCRQAVCGAGPTAPARPLRCHAPSSSGSDPGFHTPGVCRLPRRSPAPDCRASATEPQTDRGCTARAPDLQWTGTTGGPAARPYRPQVTPSDGYAGGSGRSCRACRKGSCTRRQFGLFNLFNTLAKASCRDRVYHCQPTAQIHLAPYFQNEQTHYADVVSP
jgi:hypothetical protein